MATLYNDDKFLVNDGTETKTTTWKEMKLGKSSTALNDSDLFLVNDGTKTETVTWLQVKGEAGTAPVIDSVTLAEDTPDTKQRFTNQSFTTTYVMEEDGVPASTKSMRAWVLSELEETIETDEIVIVDIPTPTVYDQKEGGGQTALLSGPDVVYNWKPDLWATNVPIGNAPPHTGASAQWIFFDLKVKCNVTIGRTVPSSESTAVLWGTNDPDAPWKYVATGEYSTLREVSGGGYRYYAYGRRDVDNIDENTLTSTSGQNVYFATGSAAEPELTFKTDKGFADLKAGDTLNQNDGNASGVIGSIEEDDLTIALATSTGAWGPANTGLYAIGPTKTISDVKQYLKLDALGSDVFEVKELRSNPDNLEVSLSTYDVDTKTGTAQIKFGATLGVDDVPDDVLPINTSIKTEITALNGIENPDKTNVKESNPVTPAGIIGPDADMYGLRFEGQRETKLYFPNPGTGSRKATVSMWFKHTKSNGFYAMFSQGQDDNNDGFFTRFRIENGKLRVETAQAAGVQQVSMVTPSVIPEKLWQHLVVSFDSDSAMIMYLNGQEVGRRTLESSGSYPWEAGRDTNIGCLGKNASGDDIQFYEGYLSDVIYVEGQALPPYAFGVDAENSGKWGPLDFAREIKPVVGDLGPHGFYLPFNPDDGIGNDASGNGNHFTDENFVLTGNTQDTVKDTPMNSYAVLNTGANGNLEATANGTNVTYLGEANTDYYYELDGEPKYHIGGTTFSSVSGKTYNFGQQPLVNAPLDIWSDYISGTQVDDQGDTFETEVFDKNLAFDGDTTTRATIPHDNRISLISTMMFKPPEPIPCSKVRVWVYQPQGTSGAYTLLRFNETGDFIRDDEGVWETTGPNGNGWTKEFTMPPEGFSAVEIELQYDGESTNRLYAVEIDGQILVEDDERASLARGNELFQTWAEWNDYVTLRADNPEHVAKFEAIKAALESYEGDLRQYRAELLTRLVAAGFNIREIDSMDLINIEDATAWAINTGYEDAALVTYEGEYWYALSSSYNNSPDDNDPEDWLSMGPVD